MAENSKENPEQSVDDSMSPDFLEKENSAAEAGQTNEGLNTGEASSDAGGISKGEGLAAKASSPSGGSNPMNYLKGGPGAAVEKVKTAAKKKSHHLGDFIGRRHGRPRGRHWRARHELDYRADRLE